MLNSLKNWFNRMWIPNVEPRKDDDKLNPLGWGTLFFTVWISLKVLEQLHPELKVTLFQIIMEWVFLAISLALLVAIYVPWWKNVLEKVAKNANVFPIVFIVSVAGYIFGLAPGFSLQGSNQWIVVGIGFLWLITPLMVLIARFSRPLLRGLICVSILAYSLGYFAVHGFNFVNSWALFLVSAFCWWPCIWPKRFRDISVI